MENEPSLRFDTLSVSENARNDVALNISDRVVTVRHNDSKAYGGILRQSLAKPLIEISNQVTFDTFVLKPTRHKDTPQATSCSQLCIVLYGTQEAGRTVGEILDDAGIYLQHPLKHDPTLPYNNPHYLIRPGGIHPALDPQKQADYSNRSALQLSTNEHLKSKVIQVIDNSAEGPQVYSKISPSPQVRTTLKPYVVFLRPKGLVVLTYR